VGGSAGMGVASLTPPAIWANQPDPSDLHTMAQASTIQKTPQPPEKAFRL
jgi:hypothetical protein